MIFPWGREQLARTWGWKMITVQEKMYRDHQVRTAADPVLWLRWSKRYEQHG
jgi:hypothetical protein